MKYAAWIVMAVAWQLSSLSGLAAVECDTDGAMPGKWTMDFEAAKKAAAEKQLPILLDFSGSDWCGWCKLMEESVFTKPAWTAYATNQLMMVLIDFPKDKGLVPDKYVERNRALRAEYGVRGFPTFVVLDDDGKTELGRLGAGRDKTPESFQGELQDLFRLRSVEIEKFCATLDPEAQKLYRALIEKLEAEKDLLKQAEEEVIEARRRVRSVEDSIEGMKGELLTFEMRNRLAANAPEGVKLIFVEAKSEEGAFVGHFKKGDTINIQYVEGVWRINPTWPWQSPDAKELTCPNGDEFSWRCGLYGKTAEGLGHLETVSTDTERTPFAYTFSSDCDAYLLINDNSRGDGSQHDNAGLVAYHTAQQ
ncbi:MAG TPA: thioredoxin fold domain-containing protein [Pontiella sp.]